ncbi:BofC C-terminal domain-containing protein [Bifidobacterium callimiconis]|uniref:Phosphoprotein phosphatase n=1 Tax=Bifidobacterium callimiconis TaxID=2306973 RepID=A0A430F7X0_9BIFI|nr:protein phosphatase 2C domain-containing protein [Bifidobacterium callimiconis]MBT1177115.1 protein phosphatase 2C domain-containing protein [Bifidobacterium callimiconis]RSX49019.1 phosphoprotein phosphatase [Bifidobacterium callimiconis]
MATNQSSSQSAQQDQQSETTASVANATPALTLYSTTVSDVGYVRSNNQDSSFAGRHFAAICDGMGGHAGGDTASTIAIRSLAHIEHEESSSDIETVSKIMETSVLAAHDAIVGKAKHERRLSGMGTTVVALSLVSNHWVLAHIGDSRAYLLRDGHLIRATKDHSYVQHLIDTGRITEAEAKNHPQRNVVMRVLGDFDIDPRPDISIRKAKAGDRWLLCSDGLCGVLEDSTLEEMLSELTDPEECAQRLVAMALKAGSTDNVTAVIADATMPLDETATEANSPVPLVGGAVSSSLESIADIIDESVATAPALKADQGSPAQRAAALMQEQKPKEEQPEDKATPRVAQPSSQRPETTDAAMPNTGEIPVVQKRDGSASADPHDPEVARAIKTQQREQAQQERKRRSRFRMTVAGVIVAVLLVLGGAGFMAFRWSQTQYYLGEADGSVAIYQGVPTDLFGFSLSHEVKRTDITVSSLPSNWREQLSRGITVGSYDEAEKHAQTIRQQAQDLQNQENTGAKDQFGGQEQTDQGDQTDQQTGQSAQPSDSASATQTPSPSASNTENQQ